MPSAERQLAQSRDSTAQNARSRGRSLGRLPDCSKIASCGRSAKFSHANWNLGTNIARRNSANALKQPIRESLSLEQTGDSSTRVTSVQTTQFLGSQRGRSFC